MSSTTDKLAIEFDDSLLLLLCSVRYISYCNRGETVYVSSSSTTSGSWIVSELVDEATAKLPPLKAFFSGLGLRLREDRRRGCCCVRGWILGFILGGRRRLLLLLPEWMPLVAVVVSNPSAASRALLRSMFRSRSFSYSDRPPGGLFGVALLSSSSSSSSSSSFPPLWIGVLGEESAGLLTSSLVSIGFASAISPPSFPPLQGVMVTDDGSSIGIVSIDLSRLAS